MVAPCQSYPGIKIRLHPRQREAYESPDRITAFVGGLQSGKSTVGGLWMARLVTRYDREGSNFLITSPTYKHLQQSLLPWSLKLFKGIGIYNKVMDVIHTNGGAHIWFRSLTESSSIEGIPNCKAIWCDEAGMYSYAAWMAVLGRSAFAKAPIFISTTPYSQNWLYRDVYQPYVKGKLQGVKVVTCKSTDNPMFPAEEYERQKTLMDSRIFKMKYDASFEKLVGLVYPDFDLIENGFEVAKLDHPRYQFFAGVDIGFADPTVVLVIALDRKGKHIIVCDEFYRSFTSLTDKINVLKQLHTKWNITQFYCDSAHPADIDGMCSANLPVVGVVKGRDSIQHGIAKVTSVIRDRTLRVMEKCAPFTLDELNTYSYSEKDLDIDGKTGENPEPLNDHCMDALRYCIISIYDQFLQSTDDARYHPETKTHLQQVLDSQGDDKDWYNNY